MSLDNKIILTELAQIRQEVKLRDGKVIVRGQIGMRKTVKSADIVLYHKPNMPLAVIEAKANKHRKRFGCPAFCEIDMMYNK